MRTEQPDLFDRPPRRPHYPAVPGHRGVDTQVAAAKRVDLHAPTARQRVLEHLIACGGASREEVATAIGMKLQSVCGRMRELVLDGKVIDSGIRREGRAVMRAK